MRNPDQKPDSNERTSSAGQRTAVSRRALLKGSVVSMPAILTLQSGAALARSSNLISASAGASTDGSGRTLCLELDSVYPASETYEIYDLGQPPYARVTAINERDYYRLAQKGSDPVGEGTMCQEGGPFYHKPSGYPWQEVNVPRGVLVSATALTSFASEIDIIDL